jgi:hypothetical protein
MREGEGATLPLLTHLYKGSNESWGCNLLEDSSLSLSFFGRHSSISFSINICLEEKNLDQYVCHINVN